VTVAPSIPVGVVAGVLIGVGVPAVPGAHWPLWHVSPAAQGLAQPSAHWSSMQATPGLQHCFPHLSSSGHGSPVQMFWWSQISFVPEQQPMKHSPSPSEHDPVHSARIGQGGTQRILSEKKSLRHRHPMGQQTGSSRPGQFRQSCVSEQHSHP
jgi:hypothetical protein